MSVLRKIPIIAFFKVSMFDIYPFISKASHIWVNSTQCLFRERFIFGNARRLWCKCMHPCSSSAFPLWLMGRNRHFQDVIYLIPRDKCTKIVKWTVLQNNAVFSGGKCLWCTRLQCAEINPTCRLIFGVVSIGMFFHWFPDKVFILFSYCNLLVSYCLNTLGPVHSLKAKYLMSSRVRIQ